MRYIIGLCILVGCAGSALADFTLKDTGKSLLVMDQGKAVLQYNYDFIEPPKGVDEHYRRACYIHPLYGLDGEVLTQDFPRDHYHHRGVFWAWPQAKWGEQPMNIWLLEGVRKHHMRFLEQQAEANKAIIAVENQWIYDAEPDKPVMQEKVRFTVLPETECGRAIDFELSFKNVSEEVVTLKGAEQDNKGYGGFCVRTNPDLKPIHFAAGRGRISKDLLRLESPWVDMSVRQRKRSQEKAGVAIFQHAGNPGYPHPGWILRHYGFLGQSWPHTEMYELQPGDSVTLRYRLYVHRGDADDGKVKSMFEAYSQKK